MNFSFGDYEVDDRLCHLRRRGRSVAVEPRAFDLLLHLLRHRDRVVAKDELMRTVWEGVSVSDSTLSTCMNSLRRSLGVERGSAGPIETLRGRGYRFAADVREAGAAPAASLAPPDDAFVGRTSELASLLGLLEEAEAGRGGIALVTGEPGIGKTHLAERLATEARKRGARVLATRCPEGEGEPAFWPWMRIVRAVGATVGETPMAALQAPELRTLVPELGVPGERAVSDSEPTVAERFRLFDAVSRLVLRCADSAPVLLVVDDLQWADPASLELLAYLAGELRDSRVLVVATFRTEDPDDRRAFDRALAELAGQTHCTRIELRGLSDDEVDRYCAQLAGDVAAPRPLAEDLARKTDGNPFFIREVIGLLRRDGRLDPLAPGLPSAIPATVEQVIGQRLSRLSEETLAVLRLASAIGREFDLRLLAEAVGGERHLLLDALDEAAEARVVEEVDDVPGRQRFVHALVRDAVYAGLRTGARTREHERLALALERLCDGRPELRLSELAHHFYAAAERGHTDRALLYAERAAEHARDRAAYEEAAAHYARARTLLEQEHPRAGERQLDFALALGDSRVRAGDTLGSREVFQEAADLARERGATAKLVTAALGYGGSALWGMAPGAGERALLEEALDEIGDRDDAVRAQLVSRLVGIRASSGPLEPEREPTRQALALARGSGDPEAISEALHALHFVLQGPDHLDERETIADEILRIGQGLGVDRTWAIRETRAADRLQRGDRKGFEASLADAARAARESHHPAFLWLATSAQTAAARIAGRFDEAEQRGREAAEHGRRSRNPQVLPLAVAQTFELRRLQGRSAEVAAGLAAIGANLDWIGRYPRVITAAVAVEVGEAERIRESFEGLVDEVASGERRSEWLICACELAPPCHALADAERADRLLALLAPFAARHAVYPGPLAYAGPVSRALGLLAATCGRRDEAAGHFEAALAACDAIGARPVGIRTAIEYAEVLGADRRAAARRRRTALLDGASDTARDLGLPAALARIEALRA